jgi:hypothetical protein
MTLLTLAACTFIGATLCDGPGPLVPIAHGKATAYRPGLMATVVTNRVRWGHITPGRGELGYVALADCRYLDHLVYLRLSDDKVAGPFLVADCGSAADQAHLEASGFAVDLSFPLARALGAADVDGGNIVRYARPLSDVTVYLVLSRPAVQTNQYAPCMKAEPYRDTRGNSARCTQRAGFHTSFRPRVGT